MIPLNELKLNSQSVARHVRSTSLIAFVPIVIALLINISAGAEYSSFLYGLIGIIVGLKVLLWSGFELCFDRNVKLKIFKKLQPTANHWFPFFLITIRNLFFISLFLVLWKTILMAGAEISTLAEVSLIVVFASFPLRSIFKHLHHIVFKKWVYVFVLLINHTFVLACVLLAAGLIEPVIIAGSSPTGSNAQSPWVRLLIWIPVVITFLANIFLFSADIASYKGPMQAVPEKSEESSDFTKTENP